MTFIFVTIILDVLGFGILIPVLAPLVLQFTQNGQEGALMFGLLLSVWSLMQFLFSPLIGALSDRFGRRPVLILSAIGLGFDYIIMALAPTLTWLFIGRILSGITASSYPSASAYVADVTPPERRAAAFGMVGAAWGIGFIMGPALGGLLGGINLRAPFWAAAAMSFGSAVYGLFVLPESLPAGTRKPLSLRSANPLGSLAFLRRHPGLLGLAGVTTLNFLAFQVLPSVTVLYVGYRYGWRALYVGLTLTLVGVCNIAVQAGLVKPLIKRLGERGTLYFGLLMGMTGFLWYGLAPGGVIFLLGVSVFAFIGLVQPSLQSLMTRQVSPVEQGRLQGANASLMGLTGILGPLLFDSVFASFTGKTPIADVPGAPYLVAAVLMLASAMLAIRVTRPSREASHPGDRNRAGSPVPTVDPPVAADGPVDRR